MAVELKVPSFGESITEALVSKWLKHEGDAVAQDEGVVVLETDKVTSEVPAPTAGVMGKLLRAEGETVNVGDTLATIDEGATAAAAPPAPHAAPPAATPAPTAAPAAPSPAPQAAAPAPSPGGKPFVMPAAARAMADAGLSPGDVTPTGPGGRILKEDVERTAAARSASPAPQPATLRVPPPQGAVPPPVISTAVPNEGSRQEELVPMTPIRRKIAERLVTAQQTAALLTTFNEVDMSAVMELRAEHKERFEKKYGTRLGLMSFFVKAAIDGLKTIPAVNAQVQGDAILYRNYYDIGVAVGGGRGLVVPVLRDADRLSFSEIEKAIADFGKRAQENRLTLDELQGGTFTISNGGIYGSMLSTPIVNFPQSGILGLHNIQDRPVARNGQVVIRPMMYVALTYDHRIIDGREAVTFLKRVKECIENPARILLEI